MDGIRAHLAEQKWYQGLSDRKYALLTRISPALNTKARWRQVYHRDPELADPVLYCDKQAWLKLNVYNKSPFVKRLANRVSARDYVRSKGLGDILIDVYGIWDSVGEIPFDALPETFILKTTLGCGKHVICRDRAGFDAEEAKRQLKAAWADKCWLRYAEMQYKPDRNVRQQVLCERLLHTEDGKAPADYKFNCFHGKPLFIDYCFDRGADGHAKFMAMDMDWSYHPEWTVGKYAEAPRKPSCFERMREIAEILSAGIPFVRIDLYAEGDEPRFGEFTFTPSGGLDTDYPYERQEAWGRCLDLNKIDYSLLELR